MTVIAIDGMGGDAAPEAAVAGAFSAANQGIKIFLIGNQDILEKAINELGDFPDSLEIVHASDVIAMDEQVGMQIRNRTDSSIWVGMELVKSKQASAFVSMGNTGAMLAAALLHLGRLPGVQRPGLAIVLPTPGGPSLLIDGGANAESKASHLVQFADMGTVYMKATHGFGSPKVGLLSIGEEASKGSTLIQEAYEKLENDSFINFIGNIEGRDIVTGDCQVIVTDGFTGNNALKIIEGTISMLFDIMRSTAHKSFRSRLGGALLLPSLREVRSNLDYRRYGAAPLLGVEGSVFIGHGRSDAVAVHNAIINAAQADQLGILQQVRTIIASRYT
ncbi:MAG: phosphate--acyl-ACP acyltransferase [Chloroflexi bacterium]|nr:phosphate--acyl-ACP acyltransferase [Chloroflexota bacterium]